jgi:L-ascorbate metabolism protein UlaG (beta-lactamase superfamily)
MRKLTRELSPQNLENITFTPLTLHKKISTDNYIITPLRANHSTSDGEETCLNYIIESDGKTIFYGLDSGWILYESWLLIKNYKFDAFIFEATIGDVEGDFRIFGHNNLQMVEIMLSTIKKQNVLNKDGKIIVSHMAKTLHTSHKKLEKRLEKSGIVPAFDGMIAEI